MQLKFKRGDRVDYDPEAEPSDEQKENVRDGLVMDWSGTEFKPIKGTYVWIHFAHLMEWGYVIEHPDGHPKSKFTANNGFPDGFESIPSKELQDDLKYIYANEWQLKLHQQ